MVDIQSERIIGAARDLLKAYGYFVDNLWHVDDIYFLCEQGGYERISQEEAMSVFDRANAQFDGEYGINWPQLERALASLKQEQLAGNERCTQLSKSVHPPGAAPVR